MLIWAARRRRQASEHFTPNNEEKPPNVLEITFEEICTVTWHINVSSLSLFVQFNRRQSSLRCLKFFSFCLSGPLSPHISQGKTGRSELQLLSVSSDGTLRMFIKRPIVTNSFFSSSLPFIHPSPPPLPFLRRHNSHVSGALSSDSPYVCTHPCKFPSYICSMQSRRSATVRR